MICPSACPIKTLDVDFNLVETGELNCKAFKDIPTIEWAVFIRNNRDRKFVDLKNPECNLDCKYDVVVGPVADDTIGLLIRQFSRGTIDAEYMKKGFDFGKLTNQYTFHTEKSLKYLKKVDVMHDKSTAGND